MSRNPLSRLSLLCLGAAILVPASSFGAGSAPQPTICTRSCWGARAPSGSISQMSALTRAIVHHTAGSEFNTTSYAASQSYVRGIQNYHMNTNGWSDIGYHFLVDKFGNIFEARSGSMGSLPRGAHDAANTNSFGFTLMGYFHPNVNNVPTTAMMNSLYAVIAWRMPNGWSPYGSPGGTYGNLGNTVGRVDGHRRVVATACPGDGVFGPYIGTNLNGGTMRNAINSRVNPPASTTIIIDNSSSGFSASSNWTLATSSADKYGADYRYRPTAAISDTANWTANITSAGTYTVSAWWSAGSNRSASAGYFLPNNVSVPKNQQINGGSWQTLGSLSLATGNRTTKLSCWSATGYVVIADAIRYVK